MEIDCEKNFRLYENGNITVTPNRINCVIDREQRVNAGKTEKTYSINSDIYRRLSSAAVNLYRKKQYKVIFITLTFPGQVQEQDSNVSFSKFIDNLKLNYGLKNYIAVKELTQKGRPHYHLLGDIPFQNIKSINRAWCFAIRDISPGSNNCVRLPVGRGRAIVKNMEKAVKYLCKYMTKARYEKTPDRETQYFLSRCYFISHAICSKPIYIDIELAERLASITGFTVMEYTYCSIIYLKNIFHHRELIEKLFNDNRKMCDFY